METWTLSKSRVIAAKTETWDFISFHQVKISKFENSSDVGLWLEEINLGGYRPVFKENGVDGEYLESMSVFTTEQILRFMRRRHMKWGDFITLCKELRRIKGGAKSTSTTVGPILLSTVFVRVAKHNRQSRVVSLKLEP